MNKWYLLATHLVMLSGCSFMPPATNVHQPMTARPTKLHTDAPVNNGSIYNQNSAKFLFEDYKASRIGDTVTVKISESTNASTKSNSNAASKGNTSASIDSLTGIPKLPVQDLVGLNIGADRNIGFNGSGEASNNNIFNGTMTVTVIEVLDNGNLLVSGEKQIGISNQTEFVRISGVINPRYLVNNTIDSYRIADARVELKSSGYISEAQIMGWLARFFMIVLPF